jgi:sugar lactone lactonase YvrE
MSSSSIPAGQRLSLWSGARRLLLVAASAALLALGACGGGSDHVDRGPTTIPVAAKLNGLFWDAGESRLYLGDDDANAIKAWDGGEKFSVAAALPAMEEGQRTTLGQLARGPGDALYITRFGFGSYGTVLAAPKARPAAGLEGLEPTRRRISLVVTPDGTLLDGWFRGGTAGSSSGNISELTVQGSQGSERELVTDLNKPVGLAVVGDQLFVADQGAAQVRVYSLAAVRQQPATAADGRLIATFTPADGLDLMTAAEDGTLYVASGRGALYQIAPDGAVKSLVSGWPSIRGLALDAENRRLFAAVAAADEQSTSTIRIVPLD